MQETDGVTDQPITSMDALLSWVRQGAVARRASDPTAPDPDAWMARIEDLVRRYPPVKVDDGYDFSPLVQGAALEYGREPQELAGIFLSAVSEVRTERAIAVQQAEALLRDTL